MKENARNALDFADPGPLPKELMDMPGFVNGLKEYTMRTAPRPNEVLAFAGALGFSLVEAAYLAGVVSSITIKQLGVTGVASVQGVLEILRAKERSVR